MPGEDTIERGFKFTFPPGGNLILNPKIFFRKFNISSSFYVLLGITFHAPVPAHASVGVCECAASPPSVSHAETFVKVVCILVQLVFYG